MKHEIKVEGDKVIAMIGLEGKVDKDGDGIASFSFEGQVKVTADGSEIVDELLKNSAILQRVKEKLGIK